MTVRRRIMEGEKRLGSFLVIFITVFIFNAHGSDKVRCVKNKCLCTRDLSIVKCRDDNRVLSSFNVNDLEDAVLWNVKELNLKHNNIIMFKVGNQTAPYLTTVDIRRQLSCEPISIEGKPICLVIVHSNALTLI